MNFLKIFFILMSCFLLCTCSGNAGVDVTEPGTTDNLQDLELSLSESPVDLQGDLAKFYKNISYGAGAENVFDIFLANSFIKTPLVIFIHGGGFTSGDKIDIYSAFGTKLIRTFIQNGISFASINYRLLQTNDQVGVLKSLSDSKRCLQFIKRYSEQLNINKNKIALMGSSAGAGTALWLTLNDNLANPDSLDPIERESTLVVGAAVTETQATYDLVKWESIFKTYNFDITTISSTVKRFYGISSLNELTNPSIVQYRQQVDLIDLIDIHDPEIWVQNSKILETAPTTTSILYHHPYHAMAIKDKVDLVGMTGVFNIPVLGINDPSAESMVNFLIRKVNQ